MTTRQLSRVSPPHSHGSPLGWADARALAWSEGDRARRRAGLGLDILPIADAVGRTIAHDLFAITDLPHYSSSAMDGWAVSGAGPWVIGEAIRAGDRVPTQPLTDGTARPIATGAPIPPNTTTIVRREHGGTRRSGGSTMLHLNGLAPAPTRGRDIRLAGEEAARGEPLVLAGARLTPALLALAAVAGYDELTVTIPPIADVLVFGDEVRASGVPRGGEVRDAFLPSLPSAIGAAGATLGETAFGRDSRDATVASIQASQASVVISTGGTAAGPADFVRSALDTLGAHTVCDGVAMRPGHPVILARLGDDRLFLGLPGNPLAAMLAFTSLGVPLISGMLGRTMPRPGRIPLAAAVPNPTASTRLVPCEWGADGAVATAWQGTGMLRGLANADLVALVPPGGANVGAMVEVLPLPW